MAKSGKTGDVIDLRALRQRREVDAAVGTPSWEPGDPRAIPGVAGS